MREVVVVGSGIIGAAIALELSKDAGVKVSVVDGRSPDAVSRPSFAWVNAWLQEPRYYHDFRRESSQLWHEFVTELGGNEQVGFRKRSIKWADDEASAAHLRETVNSLRELGHDIHEINAEELQAKEPRLKPRSVSYAAMANDEMVVNSGRVASQCLQLAVDNGATIVRERIISMEKNSHTGGSTLSTESGARIECDVVVLAAGNGTPKLAANFGVDIPYAVAPGVLARAESPTESPFLSSSGMVQWFSSTPTHGVVSYHLKLDADGGLVFGEGDGLNVNDDNSENFTRRTSELWGSCSDELKNLKINLDQLWYRPQPIDGLPIVGFAPYSSGIYIAFMHSGVTLAPLITRLAAKEILAGQNQDTKLANFRLERFINSSFNKL